MLLRELRVIFPETRGIEYDEIEFNELFINPSIKVDKGLFVLIESKDADMKLKEALYNGAVGAIWPNNHSIPTFLPNHFPMFLVDDSLEALQFVLEKIKGDTFKNVSLSYNLEGSTHNDENGTYDNSVIAEIERMKLKLNAILQIAEREE
jgi:hypothetical protein